MKTITSRRPINLAFVLMSCFVCSLLITATVSSEAPKNLRADKAKEAIRMFDIGLGPHAFNFQLGRETKTQYLGSAEMRQLMQSEQAQPRSLVTDDFNGDGMGDLVIGYANANGGMLGLRHGNLQAIAPSDKEVFDGIGQGRYPSPFLTDVTLYSLPEAADFLQVGDFDSDGYSDVMAAARGGQRMYLLPGDGRGQLRDAQVFEVAGSVTAMQAGREQRGRFTSLSLGLIAPGGATLSVYQEGGDGLASEPQNYTMPTEVTALAYGDLNKDGTPDVAAAARNEVAVVYQNTNGAVDGPAPRENAVERTTFGFNVRGLTVGNFVFDRGHQMELALLADDGAIHLADKGLPDRRAFTAAEIEFVRQQRIAWHKGQQDMDSLTREMNKLVSNASKNAAQGAWTITETLNSGAAPPFSGVPGLLQTAKMSGLALDDLLVGNDADKSVQVVKNKQDVLKLKFKDAEALAATTSVKVEGAPLAAVAMRLSVNGLPGMVVLHEGQTEPVVGINTPDAAFAVTTTLDQVDLTPGNGVCNSTNGCSLRAAVIESNYAGGSNTITLPNGTYTLTLGPWDDEFNANGAVMESGDLDILDLSAFTGSPALTAVTINGGGRDTAIIQMGTLAPSAGGISTDRVMETNNFAIPQRGTSLTLNNLTVRNGNAQKTPAPDNYNTKGGGIQFDGFDSYTNTNLGVLTLTNSKFTTNTAAGQGGGILAIFGGLTVQTTSIVSSNTCTFAAGGGIQHSGGNVITTTLNITNSTIGGATAPEGNNAPDATFGMGAGMDSVGANAVNISGTTIRNNIGGIMAGSNGGAGLHFGNSKSIAISTSTISDNKSKHHGGGIWVSARDAVTNLTSTMTLTTVNVTGNQADSDNSGVGDGGGLYAFFGSAIVQTTSHIDGNSAVNGGGISTAWAGIPADPAAGLTVQTNSTVGQVGVGNGNSARNNGGSIYINAAGASLFNPINLNNLTFANSAANSDNSGGGDGGAIFIGAGAISSLNTCTFDGNTVGTGGTGDAIRQTGGTIAGAGTLNFNNGESISISGGTFTSTSGILNLTGNLLFTGGTFTHNSGTWVMNGSGAQTIGTSPITFFNLTINNGAGVTLNGTGTVAGTLNLTSGVLGIGTNTLTLTGPVSFTSGSISSSATGTVNYSQTAANQIVAPGSYGNLFFNNFVKVLPNGSTVNIAGTFTPGTTAPTITGSTVNFNAAGAQTVPAINYNNLTISGNRGGLTVTLPAATIGVAGVFTPSATNVVYAKTGNTFDFNGAGAQTVPAFDFNNLTISNTHGANPVTLINGGTIGVAGTFTPGTSTFVITGNTINFNGAGAQTIPVFNYNDLTSSNTGARTLAVGVIGVAGTFTPGGNLYTITGNTMDFNGASTQTVPTFNFNNLTISNTHGANAVTLVNGGTIGVAGTFTPGTSTFVITGNTMNFNGTGAQTIPQFNFNNLTISGARTINTSVTLVNGATIGIAGTFSPTATFSGTGAYIIANNTVNFNGTGAQTVAAAFNYNNLTISGNRGGLAVTLASGNIGIAGIFNPSVTNNTFVTTGNTVIFNGSALQTIPAFTFNGLTLNNPGGANLSGNVTVGGALTLTAGALGVGANTLTLNGAVSATAGSLTSGTTGTVIYNQGSNGQATVLAANYGNLTFSSFSKTLAGTGTIGIAGTFTPGTGTGHTIAGSTINFNGAGSQTIPGFTYNNLSSSGGGLARILDPVNVIKIAGVFSPGTDLYTITGSTVEYNGSVAQTLPAAGFNTYNNLVLNNPAGTTGFAGLVVQGLLEVRAGTFTSASTFNNVQINAGTTLAGTNATTMNVSGNWLNNGTFTGNGNTVNFNGTAQTISGTGTATFTNLTVSNTNGIAMNSNNTVNGILALTSGNITVAPANTLTQPAAGTSSGAFDVNGRVQRTGFVSAACATAPCANTLSFGNLNNQITVTAGTAPANIVVDLARSVPTGTIGYPTAVQRTYTITPSAAGFTGTLRLHYLPGELNGNNPTTLNLWRYDAALLPTPGWRPVPATSRDCAAGCTSNTSSFWVEATGVTTFSPWTLNSTNAPTAADGVITGRITDSNGAPVEGAVVRLEGTQNRKFITDSNGVYRFEKVETSGFYTVTPSRVNYTFNPAVRNFSQIGQVTEAAFGATAAPGNYANPLDTPEYFVRQHYLDFLGREPDEAGFNFWSDEIIGCGADQDCIGRKRENVSAAYFLSIEFQATGGVVDGLYRASYATRPQFSQFMPDTLALAAGVVVGEEGWQAKLQANKEAFIAAFVNRAAFHALYDGMNNSQFVDTIISHTGVSFTASEREALIGMTRAQALSTIAENSRFKSAKFNDAFVMMEYFGYLRRDADADGFQYWLNKLNQFGGNFEQAEMVKAFIVSGEYRDRFPK